MYLTEAWSPAKDDQQCFQTLISDADNVLLVTNSHKKIHSTTASQSQEAPFFAPTRSCVSFGYRSKCNHTPCRHNILFKPLQPDKADDQRPPGMLQQKQVNEIETPNDAGEVTYPGSASFFAAPWLVEMIMNTKTNEPFQLIQMVNAAAIEEDENNKEKALEIWPSTKKLKFKFHAATNNLGCTVKKHSATSFHLAFKLRPCQHALLSNKETIWHSRNILLHRGRDHDMCDKPCSKHSKRNTIVVKWTSMRPRE